ncbi:hypothetical protein JJC00_07675 [Bradyrhizobium diazoefficiens]|uniref:hypothetical protein n=1 Tax=Bradyrhizobium diazoefficiens TaxID=1355477 RepID=UPI00190C8564|nr:hypothetical protein [Bradyrhizobium diazoefficiens]QQO35514.1 hypothetical protein JJC00_07675 [Bradyrhizobium diazoefficiens]
MNAEDWATALFGVRGGRRGGSGASPISAWSARIADLVLLKMHDTRSGLPFVHEFRDAIDQKSTVRTAAAMRRLFDPARDNVLAEAFAMARCCQDTSWPWILRKKPTAPSSCPMDRSRSTTTRAAKTVRAIKLVELKTTSLDGAELIADETEQPVPVLIAPVTAIYNSEVAFDSGFYAVQNES